MHILLLTSSYKSEFNTVSALFFRDQALALKNNKCQVGVLCPLPISFKSVWIRKSIAFKDEEYDDNGIYTYVSPFLSIPKSFERSQKIRFRLGKQMFEKYIIKNGKPDIIHVHSFLIGELALWIKEKYSVPFVVTEHSSGFFRKVYSQKTINFAKTIYSNSKACIAVSEQFCKLLTDLFNISFKYIPNVVDTSFFTLREKSDRDEYVFLNIGHLDEKKNQAELIRAFSNQFKGNQKYQLKIVGQGVDFDTLRNLIDELEIYNQVHLLGKKSREEVKEIIQKSDCFVLASRFETFGVVLIEAMSCGLSVLSTKSGGPESIITDDKLGMLCEHDELEKGFIEMTKKKFDSKLIRDYVLDHFSEEVVAHKLIQVYNE
jgi:glycosyltransferase involved in cell wall biosynthesis